MITPNLVKNLVSFEGATSSWKEGNSKPYGVKNAYEEKWMSPLIKPEYTILDKKIKQHRYNDYIIHLKKQKRTLFARGAAGFVYMLSYRTFSVNWGFFTSGIEKKLSELLSNNMAEASHNCGRNIEYFIAN